MSTQEQLAQLQASWPETTDYLTRVGRLQNDLMILREAAARESLGRHWTDRLAIEIEDLLHRPTATEILKYLHRSRIRIDALYQLPEYQLESAEQAALFSAGEAWTDHPLEEPSFQLSTASDELLWSSPELGWKLTQWAAATTGRLVQQPGPWSLTQATIILRLMMYFEQEQDVSPEWVEESLRQLLSETCFEMAGNPPASN